MIITGLPGAQLQYKGKSKVYFYHIQPLIAQHV